MRREYLLIIIFFFVFSCVKRDKEENNCGKNYYFKNTDSLNKKLGYIFKVDDNFYDFVPLKKLDINNFYNNFIQENIDTGFQLYSMMISCENLNRINSSFDTLINYKDTSDKILFVLVYLEYIVDDFFKKFDSKDYYTVNICLNYTELNYTIELSPCFYFKNVIPLKSYNYQYLWDTTIVRM
jgi:hypothetical protein